MARAADGAARAALAATGAWLASVAAALEDGATLGGALAGAAADAATADAAMADAATAAMAREVAAAVASGDGDDDAAARLHAALAEVRRRDAARMPALPIVAVAVAIELGAPLTAALGVAARCLERAGEAGGDGGDAAGVADERVLYVAVAELRTLAVPVAVGLALGAELVADGELAAAARRVAVAAGGGDGRVGPAVRSELKLGRLAREAALLAAIDSEEADEDWSGLIEGLG